MMLFGPLFAIGHGCWLADKQAVQQRKKALEKAKEIETGQCGSWMGRGNHMYSQGVHRYALAEMKLQLSEHTWKLVFDVVLCCFLFCACFRMRDIYQEISWPNICDMNIFNMLCSEGRCPIQAEDTEEKEATIQEGQCASGWAEGI